MKLFLLQSDGVEIFEHHFAPAVLRTPTRKRVAPLPDGSLDDEPLFDYDEYMLISAADGLFVYEPSTFLK